MTKSVLEPFAGRIIDNVSTKYDVSPRSDMYTVLAQKWLSQNKTIHYENWYLNYNCFLVMVSNSRNTCPV